MKKFFNFKKISYRLISALALLLLLGFGATVYAQTNPVKQPPQGNPTAVAGFDATICETGTLTITDASATNYTSVTWTTDGDGSFTPNNLVNTIYTPGTADKANVGFITLMLTAYGTDPVTQTASDSKTLTILDPPTANAGADFTICDTETYTLSDATAANYSSISWTTSGDGTFNNQGALNPIYTPGTSDKTNGTVTLTLKAVANTPCSDATNEMVLTIQASPTADTGDDDTICDTETSYTLANATADNYESILWATLGDGTFDDDTDLNPVYYPSANDISAGSVKVYLDAFAIAPCDLTKSVIVSAADTLILNFQASPTAAAGENDTICDTQFYTLSDATAENYSSITWTTTGDGSFTSISALNPTYSPGITDKSAGSVTLTITAVAEDPCIGFVDDDILLTIQASPTVDTGGDDTICDTDTYTLSDATASDYDAIEWTTSGNGTFDDDASINPIYTPGSTDKSSGEVTLTITAAAISPCGLNKEIIVSNTDDIVLTIQASPIAYAGIDATICEDGEYELDDADLDNQDGYLWETSGDGTLVPPGEGFRYSYIPGPDDIVAGTVEICLTAYAKSPCVIDSTDCMTHHHSKSNC